MGLFDSVGKFLGGSGDKIKPAFETDYARRMREALEGKAYAGMQGYDPNALIQQGQNAFNAYNTNMTGLMQGQLPSAYSDQLNNMRDQNLAVSNRQIQEAAGLQAGGLMSNLAKRGVLGSSVTADSLGQIGKSAANAMSDASARENAAYSQNYLNSVGQMANMNQTNLGAATNYGTWAQNQALQPAQYLYGMYNQQQPIVQQGSPGFLAQAAGGIMQGIGQALPMMALASDKRLKIDIHYTGETIDGVPVATWEWTPEGVKISGDAEARGFIAQDVAKVHPDRVFTGDDGYLRINKSAFSRWPAPEWQGV